MRWRLELMHKDRQQLDHVMSMLAKHPKLCRNLEGLNVPNKDKGHAFLTDTLRWLRASEGYGELGRALESQRRQRRGGRKGKEGRALASRPPLDVCLHWSMKFQAPERLGADQCVDDFCRFVAPFASGRPPPDQVPASQVLIVTGSKPRKNDSLRLFQSLAESKQWRKIEAMAARDGDSGSEEDDGDQLANGNGTCLQLQTMPALSLHAAFNPFLESEDQREQEYARLRRKVATGACAGIWLQIGSDLALLKEGLEFLALLDRELAALPKGAKQEQRPSAPSLGRGFKHFAVYAGLFLPSKQLLAQQRFRPWAGVKLTAGGYLNSLEEAKEVTRNLLRIYGDYGVTPLFESKLTKVTQLQELVAYLDEASELS